MKNFGCHRRELFVGIKWEKPAFLVFLLTFMFCIFQLKFYIYNKKIKRLINSMFLKISFDIFPIVEIFIFFFNSWHTWSHIQWQAERNTYWIYALSAPSHKFPSLYFGKVEWVGVSAPNTASDKVMRENGTNIFATHLVYTLIIFMVKID